MLFRSLRMVHGESSWFSVAPICSGQRRGFFVYSADFSSSILSRYFENASKIRKKRKATRTLYSDHFSSFCCNIYQPLVHRFADTFAVFLPIIIATQKLCFYQVKRRIARIVLQFALLSWVMPHFVPFASTIPPFPS